MKATKIITIIQRIKKCYEILVFGKLKECERGCKRRDNGPPPPGYRNPSDG
jgi:hypothetical protein